MTVNKPKSGCATARPDFDIFINRCATISFQVLIVAGGMVDDVFTPLSSSEKMTTGARAWTTIKPLPRTLWGRTTVNLDNQIVLTGKWGGVVVLLLRCIAGGHDGDSARAEILASSSYAKILGETKFQPQEFSRSVQKQKT